MLAVCILYFLASCETATTVGAHDDGVALKTMQSHESVAILGKAKTTWRKVVGRKVTVEGIAWADGKGLGARVILDETTVYMQIQEKGPKEGKLVSVTGILKLEKVQASKRTSQGFGDEFVYYTLANPGWKYIDEVTSPWVVANDTE
jgi:hypothetical protein